MTSLEWIASGGFATALGAAAKFWWDLRTAKREDQSSEAQRYDQLWMKLQNISDKADKEANDYRMRLAESEQARMHEAEVCEKRIREARRESNEEAEALRSDIRKLSKLCHSQQLEIDSSKNEISSLKAQRAADIIIPGGRRGSDPPMSEAATQAG
jgi:hypothetical protein